MSARDRVAATLEAMSPRTRRIVSIAVPVVIALVVALASRSGGDGAASPASGPTVPAVVDSIAAIDLTPTTVEESSDEPADDAVVPPTRVAVEPEMGLAGRTCVADADDAITVDELPDEAIDTLELIADDGPFPYRQDGATFQNREGELPEQERGYYREYTVETPGSDDRGARRIVTGECGEGWYTDDHYDSFALIETPA